MAAIKWQDSEFARSVLSDLELIDPADRVKKTDLVDRIIPILTTGHVVNERSEALVASQGFSRPECPMIFLDVPDKHWRTPEEGGSEEEHEGMEALSNLVWQQVSISGPVQHVLPGRFLLCRRNTKRNVPTPAGIAPQSVQVAFVTEDAAVANVYFATPVIGTMVRKAESVTKQLDLAIERMPENAENVAALLSPAVMEAVNTLSQITERAGLRLGVSSEGKLAIARSATKKAS